MDDPDESISASISMSTTLGGGGTYYQLLLYNMIRLDFQLCMDISNIFSTLLFQIIDTYYSKRGHLFLYIISRSKLY